LAGNHLDVTTIGLPASRSTTRSVPLVPGTQSAAVERTDRIDLRPPAGWVTVGTVRLQSVAGYLLLWAAVMCAVLFLVLVGGYLALWVLGVVASLSKALAIVLGEPLPESGVLPFLQPQSVVPLAVLVSFLLSGLALVTGFAAVLVHNAVSSLTGGVRVRLRASSAPARRPTARVDLQRSGAQSTRTTSP